MRILLVEDEPEMARLIVECLNQSGFDADHVATIGKARESIGAHTYSLALLDRRLPDGDGVALIEDIRCTHPGVRVLMLTALDSVFDKIVGLDAGADDYLAKPFDRDELLARIRANLRRSGAAAGAQPPVTVGALSFEVESREIFVSGRPVVLHRRELALIESLVRRQGRAKGKWRARSVQAGGGYFASAGFTNFNTNRSLSPIAAYFSRSCVPSR